MTAAQTFDLYATATIRDLLEMATERTFDQLRFDTLVNPEGKVLEVRVTEFNAYVPVAGGVQFLNPGKARALWRSLVKAGWTTTEEAPY